MMYTLNLYSTVCQFYLNKIGRKKFFKKKDFVMVFFCLYECR